MILGMPAPKHVTDPADIAKWEAIHAKAETSFAKLLEPKKVRSIERVAWLSGLPEPKPFSPELREAINEARADGYIWREIAAACGQGLSVEAERRVQTRQVWRNSQA